MDIEVSGLAGVCLLKLAKYEDDRGWLRETWNAAEHRNAGLEFDWLQENESLSLAKGTVRGLHYQAAPCAQAKLVRATYGRVFSVAVDLRRSSASFGQWVGYELDADDDDQMLIDRGFAHGLVTLEAAARVAYKVDEPFDAPSARAVAWDDPSIGITWPVDSQDVVVSAKDRNAPLLADAGGLFD